MHANTFEILYYNGKDGSIELECSSTRHQYDFDVFELLLDDKEVIMIVITSLTSYKFLLNGLIQFHHYLKIFAKRKDLDAS